MRKLAINNYSKSINNVSLSFIKEIFKKTQILGLTSRVQPNNITVMSHNTVTYGDKTLNILDLKIYNSLPQNMQSESF